MEGNIADALKFSADQAVRAEQKKTTFEALKFEPPGFYVQHNPDGTAELKRSNPDWHKEKFDTPLSLRDYIHRNREDLSDEEAGTVDAEIYITPSGITLIHSAYSRRDRSHCALKLSEQFIWLRDSSRAEMDQRTAYRTLRILFRDALQGNLLNIIRQVKFSTSDEGHRDIQQGRESMGRAITSQVQGTDALPDEFRLNIPIFENYGHRVMVDIALEVSAEDRTFRFTPYPQSLVKAMDAAIENLVGIYEGEGMPPVYLGSPE